MEQDNVIGFNLEARVLTVLTEEVLAPGPENVHVGKARLSNLHNSALAPGPELVPVRLSCRVLT